jgi:hypothetical protein
MPAGRAQIERLNCPAAVAQPRDRFCLTPPPNCLESVADRAGSPSVRQTIGRVASQASDNRLARGSAYRQLGRVNTSRR